MRKPYLFSAVASLCSLAFGSSQTAASQADIVKLEPFVVEDSKAGAFCVRLLRGDTPRLWFVSLDNSPPWPAGLPRGNSTELHLVPLRSFDLQSGDEIVRINGKPLSAMSGTESLRALLGQSNAQPVSVEVQRPGAKRTREATFVLQTALRMGIRVLKNN